jgi:thioredoxin reductase
MASSNERPYKTPASDATRAIDVVVAGGGLAGLAGALTLARARRSVLVIDGGHPRNAPTAHTHGYLTLDGTPPLELLSVCRAEVCGYGGEIIDGTVASLACLPGSGFQAELADGTSLAARRVLVATGLVDVYPDIPGLADRWGRDVVHCPFCFGWELRGQPLGVLATGPQAAMQALMWRQWSADVALFLHTAPRPSAEQAEQLAARGIGMIDGEVTGIEVAGDRLSGVRLHSGHVVPRTALVIGPQFEARHALVDRLGVSVTEHPLGIGHQVQADATGLTVVPGLWVAGNVADVTAGVMQSAASGVTAATAINADLTAEDTARAVTAARTPSQANALSGSATNVVTYPCRTSRSVTGASNCAGGKLLKSMTVPNSMRSARRSQQTVPHIELLASSSVQAIGCLTD